MAEGSVVSVLVAIRSTMRMQDFFKRFFLYCFDSYRQPRIKHKNLWLRFELPGCFLFLIVQQCLSVCLHFHVYFGLL